MISLEHNDTKGKRMACHICGCGSAFQCPEGITQRESICPGCGVSQRTSDVARVIIDTFLKNDCLSLSEAISLLSSLYIFEAQSTGAIHEWLKLLPHYISSEYFDDIDMNNKNGVRCEDLQNLTFSDSCFDLIITQDVFEHIKNPDAAFKEIYRILKPGGYHIFTVPYHEGRKTITRIKHKNMGVKYIYPLVYHYDPLRAEGAPVFTDFGEDLTDKIASIGFITDTIRCSAWYTPDEIPTINDANSFNTYLKYYKTNDLCRFFKYNSWVFRSQKPSCR
jgi:SAM-dependent methyltransferase